MLANVDIPAKSTASSHHAAILSRIIKSINVIPREIIQCSKVFVTSSFVAT